MLNGCVSRFIPSIALFKKSFDFPLMSSGWFAVAMIKYSSSYSNWLLIIKKMILLRIRSSRTTTTREVTVLRILQKQLLSFYFMLLWRTVGTQQKVCRVEENLSCFWSFSTTVTVLVTCYCSWSTVLALGVFLALVLLLVLLAPTHPPPARYRITVVLLAYTVQQ